MSRRPSKRPARGNEIQKYRDIFNPDKAALSIRGAGLKGATFAGLQALRDHGFHHQDYARVIRSYAKDRCEGALWEDLSDLGFDSSDIAWHAANPGEVQTAFYA